MAKGLLATPPTAALSILISGEKICCKSDYSIVQMLQNVIKNKNFPKFST